MSSDTTVTSSYLNVLTSFPNDKSVQTRGLLALSALVTPITCAIDTIVGIGAGIGAVVTGGCFSSLNNFAVQHITMSEVLLAMPCFFTISAINLESKMEFKSQSIFSESVCNEILGFAVDCSKSDNFVKKHVVSRLSFALFGIAALVTKLAEAIIGLPFVFLATVTLGNFEKLNRFALLTLGFPGVILSLFMSALCTVNPKLAE